MYRFQWPSSVRVGFLDQLDHKKVTLIGVASRLREAVVHPLLRSCVQASEQLKGLLELGDFKMNAGQLQWICLDGGLKALFVGLGDVDDLRVDAIRSAFCQAGRLLLKQGHTQLQLCLPSDAIKRFSGNSAASNPVPSNLVALALEGLLLAQDPVTTAQSARQFLSLECLSAPFEESKSLIHTCESVLLARRMVNANADEMTPEFMAQLAQRCLKQLQEVTGPARLSCEVLDEKQLQDKGMGLILAVGQAAIHTPRLITLTYFPEGCDEAPVLLVGKGISYDTGGLKLKTGDGMLTMRCDMAGAATVLAAFRAYVLTGGKRPLVVMMACAENAIGPASYKLGDVFESYAKKSVEITNTDAEGRLVLADALSYGIEKFQPSRVVDIATLTGAVLLALGHEVAGLLTTHDSMLNSLMKASKSTGEGLWPLPLFAEYEEYLKSDVADIKNSGPRVAAVSLATTFLKAFVPSSVPWAHVDMANTAFSEKDRGVMSKLATGYGVRLLLEWMSQSEVNGELT